MFGEWWVTRLWDANPAALVSWVIWVVVGITLHELGHGWAAIRRGDTTPIVTGHMTWNPIVHMGQFSLLMFALVGIAWGAMPVDPTRMKGRYADAYVSFCGPFMNLSLFFMCLPAYVAWLRFDPDAAPAWMHMNPARHADIVVFLLTGAGINLGLFFLNLIPVPPLDGSRILANIWSPFASLLQSSAATPLAIFGIIAVFYLIGGSIVRYGFWITNWLAELFV